jgi:hypothetical protein
MESVSAITSENFDTSCFQGVADLFKNPNASVSVPNPFFMVIFHNSFQTLM